jgi:hypothetical protein
VLAPLAVNTELSPLHIADGLAVAATDGNGFTVTLTVAVPVHPAVLVPVTVYVVVEVGDTVLLEPLPKPPDQLYVLAPLAVNVEVCPLHIDVGLADAVTVGNGFTVTLTVVVAVHTSLTPVTVYVVVEVGDTVLLEPLPKLCDQEYTVPLMFELLFNIELAPLHIVADVAVAVTVISEQSHHIWCHCPSIYVSIHFVVVFTIVNDCAGLVIPFLCDVLNLGINNPLFDLISNIAVLSGTNEVSPIPKP